MRKSVLRTAALSRHQYRFRYILIPPYKFFNTHCGDKSCSPRKSAYSAAGQLSLSPSGSAVRGSRAVVVHGPCRPCGPENFSRMQSFPDRPTLTAIPSGFLSLIADMLSHPRGHEVLRGDKGRQKTDNHRVIQIVRLFLARYETNYRIKIEHYGKTDPD